MGGPRGSRPDSAARRDTRGRRRWQAGPTGQWRGVLRAAERATRASGLACAARWGRSERGVGAGRAGCCASGGVRGWARGRWELAMGRAEPREIGLGREEGEGGVDRLKWTGPGWKTGCGERVKESKLG